MVASNLNTGNETRITRRIIAEDNDWTLQTVPYLRTMALETIIQNLEDHPHLDELTEKEQRKVLSKLILNLDLKKALLIKDNDYWKRRAEVYWQTLNVEEYGGSYRRLFMEKTFQDKIENFVPNQSDYEEVDILIELVKNDIIRARFDQLLPPVPQVKLDLSKDDEEEEEEDQADHIDLTRVLPNLTFLTHIELSFGVKDVGMNFEWGFFTFTMNDAEMLATCLAKCYSLETLAITRSRLEDDQARVIIKRLLSHPRLRSINLSHNRLRCKTGRALGKMIKTVSTLAELNLEDNEIGEEGATAIALGIQCETTKLKSLNISQNIIGDNGGIAICKALMVNTTLTDLSIGANGLGLIFAKSLSATLANNSTLGTLNIVSNTIGLEGGQSLSSGMDLNTSLRKIDLRLSGAGLEAEHAIANKLKSNSETKIIT